MTPSSLAKHARPVLAASAAVSLILAACGRGGSAAPPQLPLSLSGGRNVGTAAEAAMDADAAMGVPAPGLWAPTTYVAGASLPTLGGERTVYRIVPGTDDDLRAIANALGLSGDVVQDGQARRIPAGEGALETWDGTWFGFYTGRAMGGVTAVACSPDAVCEEPAPPERPDDLPSADQARQQALAVLEAAGLSLEGADITVNDGITAWYVTVQYRVAGMLVEGLSAYATVDGSGIVDVSGPLGRVEEVGAYATISATDAVDRVVNGFGIMVDDMVDMGVPEPAPDIAVEEEPPANTAVEEQPPADTADDPAATGGGEGSGGAVDGEQPRPAVPSTTDPSEGSKAEPVDEPVEDPAATDEPVKEPVDEPIDEPYVEPEPVTVTLTDATWALTTFWSWDGSGIYLLPAYRYTADDGSTPVVPAVTDDVIAPPPPDSGEIRDIGGETTVDGGGSAGDPGDADYDYGSGDSGTDSDVNEVEPAQPPVAPEKTTAS